MDPTSLQQLIQAVKGIKGEIPVSTILMGILLAVFMGEKILMGALKWKAYRANGKNGNGKVVTKKLEDQAIQTHYTEASLTAQTVKQNADCLGQVKDIGIEQVTILKELNETTKALPANLAGLINGRPGGRRGE